MAVLRVCLLLVLLLVPGGLRAAGEEPLSVEAGVERKIVAVGDTFNLHLDLDWEDGVDVKPLAIGDRLGGFVVRDVREGVASKVGDRFTRRISLLLTVFELGPQTVPPVAVVYLAPDGETLKAETSPVEIEVASILPDDAAEIRDIKDPIAVPRRWKDLILSYALLVGLAAGTAVSVLLSVKRKHEIEAALRTVWVRITGPLVKLFLAFLNLLGLLRRKEVALDLDIEVSEPHLVPEEAALKELKRIEVLDLIERGMIKDHYTLVSETVRRYLERKFEVLAMESPTSYTLSALSEIAVAQEGVDAIRDVLEEGDLVKFAKLTPAREAVASLLTRAREVVRLTGSPVGKHREAESG
ncbi:MAG: hypothetical protein ABIJ00_04110 [Candidatus Eisenbacteria bacterium]